MSLITSCLHVSLKKQGNPQALLQLLSYQPWEASDPKAVLHVRHAISCLQSTTVISSDWYVTDVCKMMTTSAGLTTSIASTVVIYILLIPLLRSTLLISFGELDWRTIADAVDATRVGSFVDGSATPTNCEFEGGNPSITQYLHPFEVSAHPDNDHQH